ncbi:AraC family transcriptional regulator [Eggerthella lenta]|nr:conserved domain protein [Eggerthella sp. HGA1]RDC05865.1 AraC family transcriptional regulator [Eggerthella lenta]RDC15602.1 AraC family transcriptional regulator [Eggerthella lenta]RDC23805.1 AraC family transcriptional regulator [Eggerthella lenta]RGL83620.1 AraC family transcriptional regulator [Eggerthella lenta]
MTGCRHVRVRPIIVGRIKQWRFVFESAGYRFDAESGRVLCFCCDPERFWKYVGR